MDNVRTPYFCIDADRLESNLRILRGVMDRTGCKILLAQKCFSCYGLYPLVSEYLAGATASGIFEARLWHEEGSGENHVFSPAFKEEDMDSIFAMCDHIDLNSPRQLALYGKRAKDAGLQVGLRIILNALRRRDMPYTIPALQVRVSVRQQASSFVLLPARRCWNFLTAYTFIPSVSRTVTTLRRRLMPSRRSSVVSFTA